MHYLHDESTYPDMKSLCFILTIALAMAISADAQTHYKHLNRLPQAKRDSVLLAVSKQAIMTFGPGYYREYKTSIERTTYLNHKKTKKIPAYLVTYYYDPTKELLGWDYAAKVIIYENTGEATNVMFGNGWGLKYLDDSTKMKKPYPQIKYHSYPLEKTNDGNINFIQGTDDKELPDHVTEKK